MKKGNADAPIIALLLLLAGIIGFFVYLYRDHQRWYSSDELEMEYYVPSVRTEAPIPSEQYEDFGINVESQQVEDQQETHRSKFIQDVKERITKSKEVQTID